MPDLYVRGTFTNAVPTAWLKKISLNNANRFQMIFETGFLKHHEIK